MADIVWSSWSMAQFTPEERDCAANGGVWDRVSQSCIVAQTLPPAAPLLPVLQSSGTVDAEQMLADGFVYVSGKWVRWDSPEARGAGQTAFPTVGGGARPTSSSVLTVISSGSVLGYEVPAASAVALPSFVGGNLGTVRIGGGMRPIAGGTPKRVVMGPGSTVLPQVRMGPEDWGR